MKEKATIQIRIFPRTHYLLKVTAAKFQISIAALIHRLILPPRVYKRKK